ncbi:hypothetical protein MPSEU_000279700 [Mayamaea pseudoterrestris]|nr:hypothetical protein MPSEU_000279700 [Mayamaea pseudoterrestris]
MKGRTNFGRKQQTSIETNKLMKSLVICFNMEDESSMLSMEQPVSQKRRRVDDILVRLKEVHGLGFAEKQRQLRTLNNKSSDTNDERQSTIRNENDQYEANHRRCLLVDEQLVLSIAHETTKSTMHAGTPYIWMSPAANLHNILSPERQGFKQQVDFVPIEHEKLSRNEQHQPQLDWANSLVAARPLKFRLARLDAKKELAWNPEKESLDGFLSIASPSMVWRPCQWIVVHNNNPESSGYAPNPVISCNVTPIKNLLKELESKVHVNQNIYVAEKRRVTQRILAIAQAQHFTLGKWVLRFSPSNRLDEFFERLAIHTANENLGCSVKMAPAKHLRNETFEKVLCCIHLKDFTDTAEVKRVWHALRRLGFGQFGVLGFKPEIFTLCGISSGSSWRLNTVIHSFQEALTWVEKVDDCTENH